MLSGGHDDSCLLPDCMILLSTQVDEATAFAPLVRGEIGGFAWHVISDLPATKEASLLSFHTPDGTRLRFHNVRSQNLLHPQH